MSDVVTVIYEKGVFRPLNKVDVKEHTILNFIFSKKEDIRDTIKDQKKAIMAMAGKGKSTLEDVSENHDKYLYPEV